MYTEDTITNHHGFIRNVEEENKISRNKWADDAKKTDMNVVGSVTCIYNFSDTSNHFSLMMDMMMTV